MVNTSTPAALDSAKPQAIAEAPPRATPSSKPDEPAIASLPEDVRQVLEVAQKEAASAPGSAEKIGRVGMVLLANGMPNESLKHFEKAREIVPLGIKWWYFAALAHEALGDREKAIFEMQKAVESDPKYIPARMRLAELFSNEDSEKAAAEYRAVLREDPSLGIAHLFLGQRLMLLKKHEEGIAALRKAVELEPDFSPARAALASALTQAGLTEATVPARQTTTRPQDGPRMVSDPLYIDLIRIGRPEEAFMIESFAMARQGDLNGAIRNLSRYWQAHKGNMRAANALGILYGMQGKHDVAAEQFKIVYAANPDFPEIAANLALSLIQIGKPAEAEQILTSSTQRNPNDPQPLEILADMAVQRGDLPVAVERLKAALRLKPDDAALECSLADVLFRQEKDDEGLQHIDAALKIVPGFHVALHLRAAARVRARDDAAAQRDWLTLIQSQPGFMDAYLGLTGIAIRKKDYAEAVKTLTDGLKIAPNDLHLNNTLAWIRATCPDEKWRNGGDAVKRAEQICISTDQKNAEFLDTLACALAEAGRFDEAVDKEQEALRLASEAGREDLTEPLTRRLDLFRKKQPFRTVK